MKIKKYIAKNLTEGKLKIKNELGDEAVILSSRKVKKPNGTELIELVAALDENKERNSDDIRKEQLVSQILKQKKGNTNIAGKNSDDNLKKILSEFENLKKQMSIISDSVKYKHSASLGPVYGKIYKLLRQCEISDEISLKLIGGLNNTGLPTDILTAIEQIKYNLRDYISVIKPLKKTDKTQKVFVYGATGNGKTTSLIRIAIITKLILKSKVGIITTDTYKVGGAEQLETYASVSGIPFSSAYNSEDLQQQIENFSDKDFIFIDTAGKNYKDKTFIDEINELSNTINPEHKLLVISSNISEKNVIEQVECFAVINPTGVILTKLDECYSLGNILYLLKEIPIMYITTGQRIPEDLEPASKELIIKYVLPENVLQNI